MNVSPRFRQSATTLILFLTVVVTAPATAQETTWKDDVGFDQKLDAPLPLDVTLTREDGQPVKLGDYFHNGKPVIITPVYYQCPMLCGLELNGLLRGLRAMKLTAGEDFEIVTFSFDPHETPQLARKKRRHYLTQYGRDAAGDGWHFHTAGQADIDRLCEAIGFRKKWNQASGQYAHAAGIVICTPDGRTSRYLYGVEFVPRDMRLGLIEASQNRIGSVADEVMLFCYLYDPTRGKYGFAILNVIRAGGVLTVLTLAGSVVWMIRRERQHSEDEAAADEPDPATSENTPDREL